MPEIRDALDAVLLGLFLFGLLFTLATLLLGVSGHGFHHTNVSGHPHGHGHVLGRGHGRAPGRGGGQERGVLTLGFGTVVIFLTWLGGVGFVLRRAADWPLIAALPAAAVAGAGVAALMQFAVAKLSDPAGSVLEPEHYRLPGTLGRLSSSIRAGGTGEVVYEQGGVRHVTSARAPGTQALPRGTEVVVLRVERGIAMVEAFDPFSHLDDNGQKRVERGGP